MNHTSSSAPRVIAHEGWYEMFPGSAHVRALGLERVSDIEIWEHAKRLGYAIVTKDGDYHHLSFVHGAPPHVVWLRTGNCSVAKLTKIFAHNQKRIQTFLAGSEGAVLLINE
jgi:predicted nuclease of predicted toxin-antitoxin system